MKKVLLVFSTRPEAIKMAPLVLAFKKQSQDIDTKVCVTAQHREMLDQVLDIFDIVPDFDLNIMKAGQYLYDITSHILLGMKEVLMEYQPDVLFVHGDTTTTIASAMSAFYQKIPVAHVEAGLRTGNIYSTWPEEANRKLTSQITKFHFAPTETSKDNLLKGNIDKDDIYVTGNTVIDALFWVLDKIENHILVMRNTTERPEALEAGTVKLVGTNPITIVNEGNKLLKDRSIYESMSQIDNPYGDGKACQKILNLIKEKYAN
ncbi:hypothetical protein TSL6_09910 [Sulfurovum sp. TSL6]|uniref:non-hydrolyzing UDP-N-acetylglucosamine 2-epimerase n=1 Tax=Sulfurovum sp. TSL6 TaxID=2826995 RepID=UPI001CC36F34|nr:UDP-N-acetylglucosamine 2-epimerase (non-hydrolyzing) [Sulfurovum sp. TSL6]GIU00485.1 hypothetical protein TSL6_09910 [Sulfurovum sp. TSL6]